MPAPCAWGSRPPSPIPDLPGRKFPGHGTRTANALDPATRTLLVEVQVANPAGTLDARACTPRWIWRCRAANPPLLIPGDTLVVRSDGPQVAVVDPDGMVHFKRIHLGRDFGDHLEVLVRPAGGTAGGRESQRRGPRRRQGEARRYRKEALMFDANCSRTRRRCAPCWHFCRRALLAQPSVTRPVSTPPAPRLPELAARARSDPRRQPLPFASGRAGPGHREQSRYRTAALHLPVPRRCELLRAQGGGATRGLNYTLAEVPAGVGGPLSPVVTSPATSGHATTGNVGAYERPRTGRARRAADQLLACRAPRPNPTARRFRSSTRPSWGS